MKNQLRHFSVMISRWGSSNTAFALSIVTVVLWILSEPFFHSINTWLITITVITDIIIFIMVFSIQNTQSRDSKAIQLKLNELITANKKARDSFIGLEELSDEELQAIDSEFKILLSRLDVHPAMHKLHSTIKQEKAKRPNFQEQTGRLVDALLSPINGKDHNIK